MKSTFAPYVLGNWKMNSSKKETQLFFQEFNENVNEGILQKVHVGFAPAFTLLDSVSTSIKAHALSVILGSQNIHWEDKGAHTGEISPLMLKECNVAFAIIGHSERRANYGENSKYCALRVKAATAHGIIPVLCIGENEAEYRSGRTEEVVTIQLRDSLQGVELKNMSSTQPAIIIAYEPVWAIGTGLSAKPEEANAICKLIKNELSTMFPTDIPVLYGGSADDKNASTLIRQDSIDGFLVGGASLKPAVFSSMIKDCSEIN